MFKNLFHDAVYAVVRKAAGLVSVDETICLGTRDELRKQLGLAEPFIKDHVFDHVYERHEIQSMLGLKSRANIGLRDIFTAHEIHAYAKCDEFDSGKALSQALTYLLVDDRQERPAMLIWEEVGSTLKQANRLSIRILPLTISKHLNSEPAFIMTGYVLPDSRVMLDEIYLPYFNNGQFYGLDQVRQESRAQAVPQVLHFINLTMSQIRERTPLTLYQNLQRASFGGQNPASQTGPWAPPAA